MKWSNFETPEGQIISIDMDELVAVINYPGDRADLCLKNGTLHTVIFMGQWKTGDQYPATPLPDYDPEILRNEIQDLKLENDRLRRREELYEKYLNYFDCYERTCIRCSNYRPEDAVSCKLALRTTRHKLINELKKKLEDL